MNQVKKIFVEFKSIFKTEDVLKENEEHANIVTATTMINIFFMMILVWLLNYFDIFHFDKRIINAVVIRGTIGLLVPAFLCLILKGKGKALKAILIISLIMILALISSTLTYTVSLLMVIPVILSSRYYAKKFTIAISIISIIVFAMANFMSARIGIIDLNYVSIEPNENVTINKNLYHTIEGMQIDREKYLTNLLIYNYLPKLFIYITVACACTQVTKSGKSMIRKQKELSENSARIETELNLATNIQRNVIPSIFPPFPEHSEIEIYASMTPAKEVGGDFYDMFLIDEDHLAVVMADVAGKGIPAALFMMISKTLIKNTANTTKEVNKVFNKVNNMLCDGNKVGLFVTAWFGVLDLRTGKLDFVNAGHNPPLLFSQKSKSFEFLRIKPNIVLAAMEDIKYKKNEIQLEPGDRLFLYTDGVVESTNLKNEQYGEKKLRDYLNNNLNLDVTETLKGLEQDINGFVRQCRTV
ncbi:MAG: PP2C family protein-serine/threonine phosphatase [Clostridia bacterium]|nr:PP2C family protein-serine/threonine phosphatase [Clostridia bacterium]